MDTVTTRQRGPLVAGAILIVVGLAVLLGRQTVLQLDWSVWPIVVGIAILVVAIAVGSEAAVGFAALGGIVTMAGVVVAVQEAADLWASWAYAWALVVPGGVGLGLLAFGLARGDGRHVRSGLGAIGAGLVVFLILFMFFEGAIGLTPGIDDAVVGSLMPVAFLGFGILLVAAAFLLPLVDRGGTARDDGATAWGATPPASGTPGIAAAAGTASATEAPPEATADLRAIELGGVDSAEVSIAFGAGRLRIDGAAATGRLLEGSFEGGVRREDVGPGRVRLTTPADRMWSWPWDRPPFDWRLALTAEVPLRLSIETGAARTEADLSSLRVSDLLIRTGAAETIVTLPRTAGWTRVDAQGGAAALAFRVPEGVAVAVRGEMALGSIDVDEARFPRDSQGGWASPDYAGASDRVELNVSGGLGSISVR
jgi:hypothetical protein